MKKLASIALIAAGVLAAEQVLLRLYRIWWVRWYPLDGPVGYVSDGLGRQLKPTPEFAGVLFGNQHVWIGWDMIIVDVWQLTAGALCAYLLIRFGVLCFEKNVRKEPIQSPQRNAGSPPSSADSSASETLSSLGPRG